MYVEACPCVNAALWDALTLGAAQRADYVRCSLLSVFKSISFCNAALLPQRLDGGMSGGFSILRALTWVYLCNRINVNTSVIYALWGFTDKVTKWKVVVLDPLCKKQNAAQMWDERRKRSGGKQKQTCLRVWFSFKGLAGVWPEDSGIGGERSREEGDGFLHQAAHSTHSISLPETQTLLLKVILCSHFCLQFCILLPLKGFIWKEAVLSKQIGIFFFFWPFKKI